VQFISEVETTEEDLYYYLAYELQNKARSNVLLRMHMRYNKLRQERERKELGCRDARY
jgi:hypothetical protein